MTRWAAEVGPENALPEYPRPQMVRSRPGSTSTACGITPSSPRTPSVRRTGTGRSSSRSPPNRPSRASASRSAPTGPSGTAGRSQSPRNWRKGRVLLHFGAVDWESTVWVNGREAGTHRGGYDPFTYDITGLLKRGGKQEIVLRVFDPTDENNSPIARGKQVMKPHGIFYTAVTGIWQTVWLEPVPETHIVKLDLMPDIDRKTLTVRPRSPGPPTARGWPSRSA